jgi:hypothetical protein
LTNIFIVYSLIKAVAFSFLPFGCAALLLLYCFDFITDYRL